MPHPKAGYQDSNGNPVAGVTTILGQQSNAGLITAANSAGLRGIKVYGDDPVGAWTHAANVGTATHGLIEAHINRKAVDYSIAPKEAFEDSRPCFQAFLDWSKDKHLAGKTELQLVHPTLGFGGTMDFLADDGTLHDWKTSSDYSFDAGDNLWAQVAAYRELASAHGYKVTRCIAVQFPKTGAPAKELHLDLDTYEAKLAWDLFLHLLNAYNTRRDLVAIYRQQKKDKKKAQGSLL